MTPLYANYDPHGLPPVTLEDVAQYLQGARQHRMAAAVRAFDAENAGLCRRWQDLLRDYTHLATKLAGPQPSTERTSYKSEWE